MTNDITNERNSHGKSLEETRALYETTSNEIKVNAEERCTLAEKRRAKSAETVIRLQAEIDSMKQEMMKKALEHQSALDAMEVRIHDEVHASSNSARESLETELRATTAARDAMLSRRESEQIALKKERERSAGKCSLSNIIVICCPCISYWHFIFISPKCIAQVLQLQSLLEESRDAATAKDAEHAETIANLEGHGEKVNELMVEQEKLLDEITKLKKIKKNADAKHKRDMTKYEEAREIESLRWKKDIDSKDKRIRTLEKVCRERDAEKIQRIANAVSALCLKKQVFLNKFDM